MNDRTCDIVMPVFNKPDLTKNCLASIIERTKTPYNIILIDNKSGAETAKLLEEFKAAHANVTLVRNEENLGWVKAVNQGIKASRSPYVCIMNNDTLVRTDDWLSCMIGVAELEPDIGLVNPNFEARKDFHSRGPYVELDFCRGYCILIKRLVIDRIGGLDEAYGMGYYDDDDYSVRAIRAGFRCARANNCLVEHLRDSTFTEVFKDHVRMALHEKNKELFYSKWGRRLRVVLIVTKDIDEGALKDVAFSLARRQHIVYLWSARGPVGFEHINIRESVFPHFFKIPLISMALAFNKSKKYTKRYDVAFCDSEDASALLPKVGSGTYYVDIKKNAHRIAEIVDSASRA